MTDCENVRLIEFVRAELDGPETERTLAHLEVCDTCRERVRVMAAIAASGPAKSQPRLNPKVWLLAAGILVALAVPFLYRLHSGAPPTMEQLATQEEYPAPFALITRDGGPGAEPDERRARADQAYSRRDYQAAEALFSQLPADAENLFYLGLCQYYLARYEQASLTLERAIRLDARWRRPALWYQASAYLKLGRPKEATHSLSKLTEGQDEYAEKARDLLGKLEPR